MATKQTKAVRVLDEARTTAREKRQLYLDEVNGVREDDRPPLDFDAERDWMWNWLVDLAATFRAAGWEDRATRFEVGWERLSEIRPDTTDIDGLRLELENKYDLLSHWCTEVAVAARQ